jgi:SAM-dependent methyltransferase
MFSSHKSTPNQHSFAARLRKWYRSVLGAELLRAEKAITDDLVGMLFGFHVVQVGVLDPAIDLLSESRISHKIVVDTDGRLRTNAGLAALADELPFDADSVDAVLLAHSLEFADDPHAVLREVDRVLIGDGHLVLLGYNPAGLFGLWRWLLKRRQHPPWSGSFRTAGRIRDWLALLGYELIAEHHGFYRPPLQQSGLLARLSGFERLGSRFWTRHGGVYVIVARKRVVPLSPIKPRWRPRAKLFPGRAVEPTTRGVRRDRRG